MSGILEAPGAQQARQAALRRALDYLQAVGVPADEALGAAAAALRAAEGSESPFADVMRELRSGLAADRQTPPAAREGCAPSLDSLRQGVEPPGPTFGEREKRDQLRESRTSAGADGSIASSGLPGRPGTFGPGGFSEGTARFGSFSTAATARPLDGLAAYAGSVEACGLLASMPAMLRGHMTPEIMDRSPWRTPLQKFEAWLVLTSTTVSNSRLGVAAAHAVLIVPPYLLGGMV